MKRLGNCWHAKTVRLDDLIDVHMTTPSMSISMTSSMSKSMRVLLTANASYYPPKGGSTRSNLLWLEHLASKGHQCRVVCVADGDQPDTRHVSGGLEIFAVRELSRRTQVLYNEIRTFQPNWVLVSSEDVAHTLLRAAYAAAQDRFIYLAHTPQWYPFGPASWHPDRAATDVVRKARAVVAIARTTADYIRQHAGVNAHVIHPPTYGQPPWPRFGSFDRGYVLMVNPSIVKGIAIFLELAARFPQVEFAGLAGWGTTSQDRAAMHRLPNIRVLDSVPDIDDVLADARLLLMPSLWFEGFGLIAMEAMLRGLPVVASDSGGLVEAKAGTGYVIPVRPIERFESAFDETHMPRPVEIPQNIEPWVDALNTLLTNPKAYAEESERSRVAAEKFVQALDPADFERLLLELPQQPLRILLAHNSLYYPSHGGGDRSNRLLMEALAQRGHQVRVVSRVAAFGTADGDNLLSDLRQRGVRADLVEDGAIGYTLSRVDVLTVAYESTLRQVFSRQLEQFDPQIIITSTDDPGQLLFDLAIRSATARVVHLIRATIAVPFGPDSSSPSSAKSEVLKNADAVVGVSNYVAKYAQEFGGLEAVHVPISLLESGPEPPYLGRFENQYVTIANPCAVKGIGIFLQLADRMPHVQFAAVPTWGTNPDDYLELRARSNVIIMPPVDDIDELFAITRVLLVPSVWAEARSRIVVEAMERGVPVISSDAGGLPEAHMGVDYVLPVNLIRQYQAAIDVNMVPVAEVPPQDIAPWESALQRLLNNRDHWDQISKQSREAALAYARDLSVAPFEALLHSVLQNPKARRSKPELSDDKKKLLALRLRQRSWLAGTEALRSEDAALICLPWAGGGTLQYLRWRDSLKNVAIPVAVRLPGRESRMTEPLFTSMSALLDAIGPAVARLGKERAFSLFGHSMGAGIAFELCRWLLARGESLPRTLIVSAARAPKFRRAALNGPDPSDEDLLLESHLSQQEKDLLLPALRADAHLYRRHVFTPGPPLEIPVFAYGGAEDVRVSPEHIAGWAEETTASFLQRTFAGDHFYLAGSEANVLSCLRSDLASGLR
ncbi:MAG: glycosyltransferase [Bryobacteraceae bacterium]|nr:glycosyltransferase [Bryobacteraceae bacterium]